MLNFFDIYYFRIKLTTPHIWGVVFVSAQYFSFPVIRCFTTPNLRSTYPHLSTNLKWIKNGPVFPFVGAAHLSSPVYGVFTIQRSVYPHYPPPYDYY